MILLLLATTTNPCPAQHTSVHWSPQSHVQVTTHLYVGHHKFMCGSPHIYNYCVGHHGVMCGSLHIYMLVTTNSCEGHHKFMCGSPHIYNYCESCVGHCTSICWSPQIHVWVTTNLLCMLLITKLCAVCHKSICWSPQSHAWVTKTSIFPCVGHATVLYSHLLLRLLAWYLFVTLHWAL